MEIVRRRLSYSHIMNSKEIESYKKTLALSRKQRAVLVGLLLGDGYCETMNQGRTYRLKVEQSIRKSAYVEWLYEIFRDFVLQEPKSKKKTRNGKITENIGFTTVSHASFRFYAQQFYPNGKKVVPKGIAKLLSPIGIAVWFMDDGSRKSKSHRTLLLNTQGFQKREVRALIDAFELRFRISTEIRKQREGYQISIPPSSVDRFIGLIDPYILPSMRYKLEKRTILA